MKAIAIIGSSGAGKSTVARRLAGAMQLTHIELDAIFQQAEWTNPNATEFSSQISAAVSAHRDGWVMCGAYDTVADPIRDSQADTIIWLDLPRRVVLRRLLARTIRRSLTRQELWNGNREPILAFLHPNPEKNVVLYSMLKFNTRQTRYEAKLARGVWDQKTVVRLRSPAQVDQYLSSLGLPTGR